MSIYVLPQSRVFQLLANAATVNDFRANAFIFGGHAALYRYAEADEKALIGLGAYDHVGTNVDGEFKTVYSWPQKPVGSKIDASYTKLFIENATLRYFRDTSDTIIKTATNKIRHPTKAFAANPDDPTTYPAHADFGDRGVKIGDTIVLKAAGGVELCTYVRDLEGDTVAAVTGVAAGSANNQTTVTATSSSTAASTNSGDIVIDSLDHSGYSGFADGDVSETYTVEVTQGSVGGDYSTARLRIRSASGNDDQDDVTPEEGPTETPIGARGLLAVFVDGTGTDWVVGDRWTITVRQAFTAPTATSGGTYTGTKDRTYIVEIVTGGTAGGSADDDPYIQVNATDGSDFSGPTRISATATNFAVGSYGVVVQFNLADLRKGDRYTIAATAAKEGLMKTIVTAHAIPASVPLNDAGTAEIELSLFIRKDLELAEQHVSVGGQYNWEQSETEFGVFAGVYAYDAEWTVDGDPVALPIITESVCSAYNKLYLEYRAWRSDLANEIGVLSLLSELDTFVSGPLTPDNELKYALFKALQNNNGQPIRYMAVADPSDVDSWSTPLEAAEERTDIYNLVPLTYDSAVQNLVQAHVQSMSNENFNRWRAAIFPLQNQRTTVVLDEAVAGSVILATTEDDGDTSGTQYTILRITSDNADLITDGVRPGDVVRYQYTTDAWSNETYSEYVVDAVLTEDTVRLVSGTATEENIPIKVEFWRNLSKTEQSENLATQAGNWADDRIVGVWPDEVGSGGITFAGYHLCAMIAGLISGVAPHQGLTNVTLTGVDSVSLNYFNRSQLDHMAVNGVWIVTQDSSSGAVFTRHAVTTGDYDILLRREEMCRRNRDLISYRFQARYAPYIGKANATPGMIDIIEAETLAEIQYLRRAFFTPELGGQIIDGSITDIRISAVFRDRIIVQCELNQPAPLNNIDTYLTFTV